MTKRRVDIADMLQETSGAAETPETQDEEPKQGPTQRKAPAKRTKTTAAATSTRAASKNIGAKYTQLEPRTIHLWPESVDQLNAAARQLQRSKAKGQGERITAATLVRVAIARLLEESDHLEGVDEAELLESYRELTSNPR